MAKAKKNVYQEFCEIVEFSRKKNEDDQAHLNRLIKKIDAALEKDDELWGTLSTEAQEWFNSTIDDNDKLKSVIPLPPGFEDQDSDADEAPKKAKGKGKRAEPEPEPEEDSEDEDDEDKDTEDEDAEAEAPKRKGKGKAKPAKADDEDADSVDEDEGEDASDEDNGEADDKAVKAKSKDKDKAKSKDKKSNGKDKKADDEAPKKKRTPVATFNPKDKIKIIKKDAHNPDSKIGQRFSKLKTGMTVAAVHEAGFSPLDLRCDVDRGNIEIIAK